MRGGGNGSSDLNGHAIFLGGGGNVGGGAHMITMMYVEGDMLL